MLNKAQLEDITKCREKSCDSCALAKTEGTFECCEHLAQTALAYLEQNEQLQAQNAQMREAIYYVLYHLKRGGESWIKDRLESALSTPTPYHNPADIEALKLARDVLYKIRMDDWPGLTSVCEALTAIDKVVEK